jgi:hypothetical protein
MLDAKLRKKYEVRSFVSEKNKEKGEGMQIHSDSIPILVSFSAVRE